MSGHPPPTTRHLARVKPGKAPSAWRPVLALCGRKISPLRIVRSADEANGFRLCPQCVEVERRATFATRGDFRTTNSCPLPPKRSSGRRSG